jgi:hypothetical protein
MSSNGTAHDTNCTDAAVACALPSPLVARIPGVLSLVAAPAAVLVSPLFFSIAGGLLAVISLLLSPPRSRRLGMAGLLAAVVGGSLGVFVLR